MFGNMLNGGYPFMGPQMAQNGQFMPAGMSTPQQPLTPPASVEKRQSKKRSRRWKLSQTACAGW